MLYKNLYIAGEMESWFVQAYELGNDLKKYLHQESIVPRGILTVDQAITLIKKINLIDALRMKAARACIYARKHPEFFPETVKETVKSIGQAFSIIDRILMDDYELLAKERLIQYKMERESLSGTLAFEGEVKVNEVPTKEQYLKFLESERTQELDTRYKARVRWKRAISTVIKKNRLKNERWTDAYNSVGHYYKRVDEEVKTQVREFVQDQYGMLLKQHESFMKWLSLFEEAIVQAEGNISKLFENLDMLANRKARIIQMLLRATISAALSPLFLNSFIDPTLTIFNDIISKINFSHGDIDLDLSEKQTLYQMTGFLPDPDKRTYRDAYAKLSSETFYDKMERYKKYLQHKMDSLSETRELCNIMTEDSTLWEDFSPDAILHAHKMNIIDAGHYENKTVHLSQPENENALINAMVEPFETMIKQAFAPMQTQYGNKENLKTLHQFIDKITFDDNHAGPESHRQFQNNSLVKTLSNHVEIYFIVKHLVENSSFFGSNSHNQRLHHRNFQVHPNDHHFGLEIDDSSTSELVSALLKRLILIDNPELKTLLELDLKKPENKLIKENPLMNSSSTTSARAKVSKCFSGLFYSYEYQPTDKHKKRQRMLKAIIDEYYNQDLSLLLQKHVMLFAKSQGIDLADPGNHSHQNSTLVAPKWLSENELNKHVKKTIQPFINQAHEQKKLREIFGSCGLFYYRNLELVTEVSQLRAIEKTEVNVTRKGNRVLFKG